MSVTRINPECQAQGIGTVYKAAWTATSTSAWTDWVTERMTLPVGFYIVITSMPVVSSSGSPMCQPVVESATGSYTSYFNNSLFSMESRGQGLNTVIPILVSSGTVTLRGRVGTGASSTYSYLERGGMVAIKLA